MSKQEMTFEQITREQDIVAYEGFGLLRYLYRVDQIPENLLPEVIKLLDRYDRFQHERQRARDVADFRTDSTSLYEYSGKSPDFILRVLDGDD